MFRSLPIIFLLLGVCPLPDASAHYLWVTIDDQGGRTAKIIFGEYNKKHYTLLYLGTSNGKVHGMKSEAIPPKVAQKILARIGEASIDTLRSWIKDKMPEVYRTAYRTLPESGFKLLREYDINAG